MAMVEAMYRLFGSFALLCGAVVNAAPAADCSVPFNDLLPCIDFVNANSSDPPTALCCTAFSSTQKQHPQCLCQLQQAFADPATAPGNITRAAEIPSFCKVAVDYNKCPALLGLAPEPAPMSSLAPVKPPLHAPVPAPVPASGPALRTGKEYDCTNSFNTLASCLDFVSGDGKGGPPKDCCTAIGSTQAKEPICICQLLAQVNDSAQFGVNATLAMQLPALCHVTADTSGCPALLDSPLAPSRAPSPAPVASSPSALTPSPASAASPPSAPTPSPAPAASSPSAPTPSSLPSSPSPSSSVDCSNEFALLQSCFAYVMANDTTPPSVECCTALGSVVTNQPVCLCQLLQTVGSGDPAVAGINATRALGLADVCRVTTDVGVCPALLGQPLSSPLPSSPPPPPLSIGEAPGPGASPVVEAPVGEAAAAPSRSSASSVIMSSSMVRVLTFAAVLWSCVALASMNCC